MKKVLKMFSAVALLAGMMMLSGCGSDSTWTPIIPTPTPTPAPVAVTGKVAKGPTNGAIVTFSNTSTATTDVNGGYTTHTRNSAVLSASSTGGIYTDMNSATRYAPNMKTPAGKVNLTPLTTLFANANAADQAKLLALIGAVSIDTYVTGTVTSSNALIARLNETIGEVLTQLNDLGLTASAVYLANVAGAVGNLTAAQITGTGGSTLLATAVASATGTPLSAAQVSTVVASATVIGEKTIVGATVPTTGPVKPSGQNLNITASGSVKP